MFEQTVLGNGDITNSSLFEIAWAANSFHPFLVNVSKMSKVRINTHKVTILPCFILLSQSSCALRRAPGNISKTIYQSCLGNVVLGSDKHSGQDVKKSVHNVEQFTADFM